MKKVMMLAFALAGLGITAGSASADGCNGSPFCQGKGWGGTFFHQYPAPALQAAPWYLYWPYNAHFMTPGPLSGAPYFAPPYQGGGMVNPYFPAQGYQSPVYPGALGR